MWYGIVRDRLIPCREGGTQSSSRDTVEGNAWYSTTPPEGCTDQEKAEYAYFKREQRTVWEKGGVGIRWPEPNIFRKTIKCCI